VTTEEELFVRLSEVALREAFSYEVFRHPRMRRFPDDSFQLLFLQIQALIVLPAARRLATDEAPEDVISEGELAVTEATRKVGYSEYLFTMQRVRDPSDIELLAARSVREVLHGLCPFYPIC
jgi:hypothetical protein